MGGLFSHWFKGDIAIDLGTSNTLFFMKDKGILINEPSVVAISKRSIKNKGLVAIGKPAKEMLGRTPAGVEAIRPIKKGVINDFNATVMMLNEFTKQLAIKRFFTKPRAVICIPANVSEVEKRAVKESVEFASDSDVFLVEEPMAAAIGAGMPITEPAGNMIVDIGGGTTEVAVISLGGIVFAKSIAIGGDNMDEAIQLFVKNRYSLLIGLSTAERIKIRLGNALSVSSDLLEMEVKGIDLVLS